MQRLRAGPLELTACIQTPALPVTRHVTSGHFTSSLSLSLPICKMGVISTYLKGCEVSLVYVKYCLTYGKHSVNRRLSIVLTLPRVPSSTHSKPVLD